ncbi:hypothetical protein CSUB01_03856 [Colletotrichum sublineola]|uniref:Uncharacterized protein n=1 Tax=Colletotrichum sublineola TaxID=1173701 RepID=A0A066XJV1_COLSU|nr:hypothetical protein CSUB01_03856 [Colletotrichum sublineola]
MTKPSEPAVLSVEAKVASLVTRQTWCGTPSEASEGGWLRATTGHDTPQAALSSVPILVTCDSWSDFISTRRPAGDTEKGGNGLWANDEE